MSNLLIVDDEELLLNNMKILLSSHAEKIFTAPHGAAGLEILGRENIHCVICDITMPVMSGVEFIREARTRKIDVPFIFYSAYGNHELMLEVSRYGAFDFLKKPDFQDLEEVVTRGLAEGFERKQGTKNTEGRFISEYQQLLEKIQQEHKR